MARTNAGSSRGILIAPLRQSKCYTLIQNHSRLLFLWSRASGSSLNKSPPPKYESRTYYKQKGRVYKTQITLNKLIYHRKRHISKRVQNTGNYSPSNNWPYKTTWNWSIWLKSSFRYNKVTYSLTLSKYWLEAAIITSLSNYASSSRPFIELRANSSDISRHSLSSMRSRALVVTP